MNNPTDSYGNPRSSLSLSIVVATVDPWPTVQGCLDSLLQQAKSVEAEIIVADGHGQGLPESFTSDHLVWLRRPGASIFQARALGLAQARGDIVAVTEDHCRVAPDWCQCILEAYQRHPEAMIIGGAVENGATGSLLDWMHFLIANGHSMRPLEPGGSMTGQANISYRREVLATDKSDLGVLQMQLNRDLAARGARMLLDPTLLVWHDQPLSWRGAMQIHFHNGRCIAGFRLPRLSRGARLARLMSCTVLPWFLTLRVLRSVFRKRRMRLRATIGLPILFLLGSCHACGEATGYLAGIGDSPRQMR